MFKKALTLIKCMWARLTAPSAYDVWTKEFAKLQVIKKQEGMSPDYWAQWGIVCDAYEKMKLPGKFAERIRSDMRKPVNQREHF